MRFTDITEIIQTAYPVYGIFTLYSNRWLFVFKKIHRQCENYIGNIRINNNIYKILEFRIYLRKSKVKTEDKKIWQNEDKRKVKVK